LYCREGHGIELYEKGAQAMDSDTINLLISVGSALVAVASAVLAYRARAQARNDLFEGQRDALILAMAENDNRSAYVALRAAVLQKEVRRRLPTAHGSEAEELEQLWNSLAEVETTARGLVRREYTASSVESLRFSEDAILELRRLSRAEQVIAKVLHNESFGLLFDHVRTIIGKTAGEE
jgi:hypothetical protein